MNEFRISVMKTQMVSVLRSKLEKFEEFIPIFSKLDIDTNTFIDTNTNIAFFLVRVSGEKKRGSGC